MQTVWTIGHSTRSFDDFLGLLEAHGIRTLVDVRHYPSSRRFPHFNAAALREELAAKGIEYVHEVDLGGRRKPLAESANTYWRHPQFRGYADYQATPAYHEALERLIQRASRQPTAIMCAEAVPWRCHRQLIADSLSLRGFEVRHVLTPDKADRHVLNPAIQADSSGQFHYLADCRD